MNVSGNHSDLVDSEEIGVPTESPTFVAEPARFYTHWPVYVWKITDYELSIRAVVYKQLCGESYSVSNGSTWSHQESKTLSSLDSAIFPISVETVHSEHGWVDGPTARKVVVAICRIPPHSYGNASLAKSS
jgi:hypothetical protein